MQHAWGGVYTDPVEAKAEIAYTYAFLEQLIHWASARSTADLRAVIAYSQFRGACSFLERVNSESAENQDGWLEVPGWVRHDFDTEPLLLSFAARELCNEPVGGFVLSVKRAAQEES